MNIAGATPHGRQKLAFKVATACLRLPLLLRPFQHLLPQLLLLHQHLLPPLWWCLLRLPLKR